jgi:hypothetical protein
MRNPSPEHRGTEARRRVLVIVIVVAAAIGTLSSLPHAPAPHSSSSAGTYVFGSFTRRYSGSVVVALPVAAKNTSWYTNWIMLVAADSKERIAPFVQIGEIRYKNPKRYPSLFVAYEMPKHHLVYQDFGRIAEGEHTVSIAGDERTIALKLGDRLVERVARTKFFRNTDRIYYQFSTEVDGSGDSPTGYFRDIEVKDDRWSRPRHEIPACIFHSRGLDLRVEGDRYLPYGRYVPGSDLNAFRNCGRRER